MTPGAPVLDGRSDHVLGTKRLHVDRAPRRYRDYRYPGRDPVPGLRPGQREGPADRLPLQSPAGQPCDADVRAGLRRVLHAAVYLRWTEHLLPALACSAAAVYQERPGIPRTEQPTID